MLKEKIQEDLKLAMRNRSGDLVNLLRFLLAELHGREIEKRGTGQSPTLTDEDVVSVLQREVKKRREAIGLFRKGGRVDLASREEEDVLLIGKYLPAELTEAEIEAVLDNLHASGFTDFASLMREAMKRFKGRADGNVVASLVREKLNG